mgnify:CR=1 FL=1
MKYTDNNTFTTQELSILETLQELEDVVHIAKMMCRGIHKDGDMPDFARGDAKYAYTNLDEAEDYITHLRKKIKIALEHVPENIQKQEYL